MSFPIFTLQDVDPRFNETAVSNIAEVMQQAQQIRDDKEKYKEQTNRRFASGLSSAGAVIGLIPTPFTRILGTLMGVPDLIYDGIDFYNEPNGVNAAHLAFDVTSAGKFFSPYTKFLKATPNSATNIFKNIGIQFPGFVDDTYNAYTGRDGIQELKDSAINIFAPKQQNRQRLAEPNRATIKTDRTSIRNNTANKLQNQIKYFPFYNSNVNNNANIEGNNKTKQETNRYVEERKKSIANIFKNRKHK